MKKIAVVGVALTLAIATAAPAVGQTFRDRLNVSGTSADGVVISATVVDEQPGDFFSVSTSTSEPCVDGDGVPNNIVTLTSLSLPDAFVDVPELLKSVEASGTGTQTVTVIDRCAPSITTTEIDNVSATLSGVRTSKLDAFGGATFTGSGTGTLTVGGVTAEVTILFQRRPLT